MFLPEKNRIFFRFVAALFRLVARCARVGIEDSSENRFASTAYFTKPGFVRGECSGGKQPWWNLPGGIYRSPDYRQDHRSKNSIKMATDGIVGTITAYS